MSCTLCGSDTYNRSQCKWKLCIDCEHAKLTKLAFAKCLATTQKHWFPSPVAPRECGKFTRASETKSQKNRAQYKALGGNL